MKAVAIGLLLVALAPGGGLAQSTFGDTSLTYSDGVVHDDDLVPGRPPNRTFLLGEGQGKASGRTTREIPPNSPDLIGPDGRIRSVIGRNDPRFNDERIRP
jgi:hypothetical protein